MNRRGRRGQYDVKVTSVWMAVLITCLLEVFLYTWCSVQCTRQRYELGRQEKRAADLAAEKKALRIEIARLKTPARIMGIAREKLGMVMPETNQVIIIP